MNAIEFRGVTKRFGDVIAVRDLDLTITPGTVFGFLGPNGAGKTTSINLLLDFIRPSTGQVRVLGMNAQGESVPIKERTGVLPEGFSVYDRLTGRQHVVFAIESKNADTDPDPLLSRVGLSDAADRTAGGYSKGMKQRLALAMALVGEPELLILDEPSTGLDPNGARQMRDIVKEENERGATVFFSSHILGQVEEVCDRVGILRAGELVAEDSIESLRETIGSESTLTISVDHVPEDVTDDLATLSGVSGVETSDDRNTIVVRCGDTAKTEVLSALAEAGVDVETFETDEASLEDLFMAYTEDEPVTEPSIRGEA